MVTRSLGLLTVSPCASTPFGVESVTKVQSSSGIVKHSFASSAVPSCVPSEASLQFGPDSSTVTSQQYCPGVSKSSVTVQVTNKSNAAVIDGDTTQLAAVGKPSAAGPVNMADVVKLPGIPLTPVMVTRSLGLLIVPAPCPPFGVESVSKVQSSTHSISFCGDALAIKVSPTFLWLNPLQAPVNTITFGVIGFSSVSSASEQSTVYCTRSPLKLVSAAPQSSGPIRSPVLLVPPTHGTITAVALFVLVMPSGVVISIVPPSIAGLAAFALDIVKRTSTTSPVVASVT